MKKLLLLALLASCQSADKQPAPMEPEEQPSTVEPDEPSTKETPDQTYVREFDECTRFYKECLRRDADKVCFPKRQTCVIKAYRKLKKARGQG